MLVKLQIIVLIFTIALLILAISSEIERKIDRYNLKRCKGRFIKKLEKDTKDLEADDLIKELDEIKGE